MMGARNSLLDDTAAAPTLVEIALEQITPLCVVWSWPAEDD